MDENQSKAKSVISNVKKHYGLKTVPKKLISQKQKSIVTDIPEYNTEKEENPELSDKNVSIAGSKSNVSRMETSLKMNTKGQVVTPGSKLATKNLGSKMAGSKVNAARETQYQGISCPQTLIGKNTKR